MPPNRPASKLRRPHLLQQSGDRRPAAGGRRWAVTGFRQDPDGPCHAILGGCFSKILIPYL